MSLWYLHLIYYNTIFISPQMLLACNCLYRETGYTERSAHDTSCTKYQYTTWICTKYAIIHKSGCTCTGMNFGTLNPVFTGACAIHAEMSILSKAQKGLCLFLDEHGSTSKGCTFSLSMLLSWENPNDLSNSIKTSARL